MRAPRSVLCGVVALALTGCGVSSTGAEGSPAPSSSAGSSFTASSPPSLPDVSIGPPLWTIEAPEGQHSIVAIVEDDLAITGNGYDGRPTYVAVLDVATGAERWRANAGAPVGDTGFTLTDPTGHYSPGADAVLVTTYLSPCPDAAELCHKSQTEVTAAIGVAALSRTDGSLVWSYTAVPAIPSDDPAADAHDELVAQVVSADDDLVVLVVGPTDFVNGHKLVEPESLQVVALDAATGELRWTSTGRTPAALTSDGVLCTVPPEGPIGSLPGNGQLGTACALDRETGDVIWTLPGPTQSQVAAAAGDRAVILAVDGEPGTTDPEDYHYRLIDTATGDELDSMPGATGNPWVSDGSELMVTAIRDDDSVLHLVSVAAGESELSFAAPEVSEYTPHLVHDGRVVLSDYALIDSDDGTQIVDRWGNPLGGTVAGAAIAFNGVHLMTRRPASSGADTYSLYAVS